MLDGCLCHCRNATGKITSSADSSSETVRRCAKVLRGDACEVLSKPFSAGGPCGGCRRSCYQSYTHKTLSASPQQDEAKAESESNEGDDSPTCNDRSLGSNDAGIDPHPATLPPTNTIGQNSFFPAHQFQTKDFRKTFCPIYLGGFIMAKRMT